MLVHVFAIGTICIALVHTWNPTFKIFRELSSKKLPNELPIPMPSPKRDGENSINDPSHLIEMTTSTSHDTFNPTSTQTSVENKTSAEGETDGYTHPTCNPTGERTMFCVV